MRLLLRQLLLLATIAFASTAQASHLQQGSKVLTRTTAQVRVSPSPNATLVGTQPAGRLGSVTAGPVISGNDIWWEINYDSGEDGWTVEDALVEAYFPPAESAGGWRSLVTRNTTPSSAQIAEIRQKTGLDWNKLKLANDYSNTLSAGSPVIVIRNGWIAGEWGSTSNVNVASDTKSFTGLALGKLFDLSNSGQLATLIDPESLVHQYLPAEFGDSDPLKREIRVKHFMTMSSGIQSADSVAFTLTLNEALTYPMSAPPGERWSYVSLPVNLLSIVVQNVSGQSLQSFFATHIAGPIGGVISSWGTWAGYTGGGAGVSLTARNLVRFGYLTLRKGQWDNGNGLDQVIRRDTISLLTEWASFLDATTSFESVPPFFAPDAEARHYYGHLFWTNRLQRGLGNSVPADAYYMHGFKDNLCIVIPSLDMIVVRLATGGPGMDPAFRSEFMSRIMAALVSDTEVNQPPTVNAGTDQTVTFPNSANLNGTVSDDGLPNPPTTVTTQWNKVSGPGTVNFGNANAVDTTASFSAAGVYVLQLSATDGALTTQDTVSITVNSASGGTVTITQEAETGNRTAPMVVKSDPSAAGGQFVEVPEGTGSNYTDSTSGGPGQVSFSISIPQSATYALWARTIAVNGASDSFYVMRNGALLREWTVPLSTTWKWNKVTNLSLSAGTLILAFRQREDGTKLDQILLTNDLGLVPGSGNQSPAVNAGTDQTVTFPNSANLNGTVSDDGLPNPPTTVTTQWNKVSGPGTVNFGNANAVDTTASFSAAGVYVLQLSATDGALTTQDTVSITVNSASGGTVTITQEAETGNRTAPMVVKSDPSAAGGQFVEVPEGTGSNYTDSTSGGPGQVSFSISIPQSATYALWARTIAVNGASDSFYVMRNGALLREWTVPLSTTWKWNKVTNLSLSAGTLILAFRQREDGTKLDQILLTNDLGLVPGSGNQSPAVNAGTDQTVTFPNSANLNGTVSDDGLPNPPTTVTTQWNKVSGPGTVNFGNANAVDTTASFSAAGVYVLQLSATDGALTTQDTVSITVNSASGGTVTITQEAETGNRTAPMVVKSDPSAAGGQFVEVPEGTGSNYTDSTSGGPGQVSFSISIPQSATYALWARTIAVNGGSDSFYVMRNGALLREWTVPLSTTWKWNKVTNLSLSAGTLILAFRQREDGTKLDQVLLTSDLGLVPSADAQAFGSTLTSDTPKSGIDVNYNAAGFVTRDFSLVVLPPLRVYSRQSSRIFAEQIKWVINNKDLHNIAYVAHLGGLVENAAFVSEWDRAEAIMKLLENPDATGQLYGIPYGIVVSDREQSPRGDPEGNSTELYNSYFGESRFSGRSYYGGQFGNNNDNHYSLFSAGGMEFIAIFIEYDPDPDPRVLAWADELLNLHHDRRAIVVAHDLLQFAPGAPFGVQGQAIYDALKHNRNLFLMLGGHGAGEARRSDIFNGAMVHTLVSGSLDGAGASDGWLRVLDFSPAGNEIRVRTYSPALNRFKTDADSQFTLPYTMTE